MNRLLTTLLVWFLMAALPLHAVAASVKLSCAPTRSHPEPTPAAAHALEHASHHAEQAAADDAHAHHGGHAGHAGHPGAANAADAGDDASGSGAADLSHSSCSACSAFCVGAVAPPSSSLSLPSFDGAEAVLVAPAEFVTGFIPEGLQRPPRPQST